jgi:hypothetical protein
MSQAEGVEVLADDVTTDGLRRDSEYLGSVG